MNKEKSIINILTYRLPQKVANQVYNEFQNRIREVHKIIDYDTYNFLKPDLKIIELLLALSIFYKRIIANLEGIDQFYETVNNKSQSEVIRIGNFNFDLKQSNNINGIIISFSKILKDYHISYELFDYSLTLEFIKKFIILKDELISEENKE